MNRVLHLVFCVTGAVVLLCTGAPHAGAQGQTEKQTASPTSAAPATPPASGTGATSAAPSKGPEGEEEGETIIRKRERFSHELTLAYESGHIVELKETREVKACDEKRS